MQRKEEELKRQPYQPPQLRQLGDMSRVKAKSVAGEAGGGLKPGGSG